LFDKLHKLRRPTYTSVFGILFRPVTGNSEVVKRQQTN